MPAAAAPDLPKAKAIGKLPGLETFTLGNGLQVAVLHSEASPLASVQIWYHAGSKDESRTRRGTAHMFEHLMFQGSAHMRPDAFAQAIGSLGGYVSAATDEDATHFGSTLPVDRVDYAIRLEAERMRNLVFRKPVIDSVRALIHDEIAQQAGSPFAQGLDRCLSVAYLKHPYAWTAIGNAHDLETLTIDEVKKFYDAYYQPNNAMLVVVGNVTAAAVKASAEKWFGPIAKAAEIPRPSQAAAEPAQTARRREVVEAGQIGVTLIGWHIPPAKDKDAWPVQVASLILGAGDSARLKVRLKTPDAKTKQPVALEAGTDALVREDPGMAIALGAYVDPAKGDAVEAAIFDEVGKLASKGPSADEVRKAKNQLQSGLVFSLENVQGMGEAIGRSWVLSGDPNAYLRDYDAIDKVTPADVQRVAKQYFSPDQATVVVIPPRAR
ncbi:MAG TPA: pitrilysin family protein [Kofleriaceae bacterium]|nr:pitrilysin family protein [Kofleriaceae bacterium]